MIVLHVTGTPAPKGSSRAMNIGGKARLIASSSSANARKQAAWHKAVQSSVAPNVVPIDGPVCVAMTLRLARPRNHYGTGRNANVVKPTAPGWPLVCPDIDKLVRCTLDALTGLAFVDDSRIVSVNATKVYGEPGAEIRVWSFAQQEAA